MTVQGPFIDGTQTEASTGEESSVRNPASGEEIARVRPAAAEDVHRAVTVAHERYREGVWRTASVRERRDVLRRIADLVRRDHERLARLESQNAGKPISAARGEISAVAETFDHYAGAVDKFHGQTIPGQAKGTLLTFGEPIGVCAAITPWNFPMVILSWKAAPALAMGNSLVVKPAGVTPLTTLALAQLAVEAGLPPGVFNVVPGRGSEAGEALVRHPLVRKISITGSTEVGTGVMQAAAGAIGSGDGEAGLDEAERGDGGGQPFGLLESRRRLDQSGDHQAVPIGENLVVALWPDSFGAGGQEGFAVAGEGGLDLGLAA